eukprot:ANDGO_07337.mRNA.1 hypothetical protein
MGAHPDYRLDALLAPRQHVTSGCCLPLAHFENSFDPATQQPALQSSPLTVCRSSSNSTKGCYVVVRRLDLFAIRCPSFALIPVEDEHGNAAFLLIPAIAFYHATDDAQVVLDAITNRDIRTAMIIREPQVRLFESQIPIIIMEARQDLELPYAFDERIKPLLQKPWHDGTHLNTRGCAEDTVAVLKAEANAVFERKDNFTAIMLYTRCIRKLEENRTLQADCDLQNLVAVYSNRAQAHINMACYHSALEDCQNALDTVRRVAEKTETQNATVCRLASKTVRRLIVALDGVGRVAAAVDILKVANNRRILSAGEYLEGVLRGISLEDLALQYPFRSNLNSAWKALCSSESETADPIQLLHTLWNWKEMLEVDLAKTSKTLSDKQRALLANYEHSTMTPVSQLFEAKFMPGKGRALVATSTISEGEILLSDNDIVEFAIPETSNGDAVAMTQSVGTYINGLCNVGNVKRFAAAKQMHTWAQEVVSMAVRNLLARCAAVSVGESKSKTDTLGQLRDLLSQDTQTGCCASADLENLAAKLSPLVMSLISDGSSRASQKGIVEIVMGDACKQFFDRIKENITVLPTGIDETLHVLRRKMFICRHTREAVRCLAAGNDFPSDPRDRSDEVIFSLTFLRAAVRLNAFADGCSVRVSNVISSINHSCVPTVYKTSCLDSRKREMICARTALKAGEELTLNYLNIKARGDLRNGPYFADRQIRLSRSWGFHCNCGRCVIDASRMVLRVIGDGWTAQQLLEDRAHPIFAQGGLGI